MLRQVLSVPIKCVAKAAVFIPQNGDGASGNTGSTSVLLYVPSHRIHWSIMIAPFGDAPIDMGTSSWTLSPCAGNFPPGAAGNVPPPQGISALQPVITAGALPDGYEGESAVKLWKADLTLVLGPQFPSPGLQGKGAIWAIATFEAAELAMSDEERAYWYQRCDLTVGTPPLLVGT